MQLPSAIVVESRAGSRSAGGRWTVGSCAHYTVVAAALVLFASLPLGRQLSFWVAGLDPSLLDAASVDSFRAYRETAPCGWAYSRPAPVSWAPRSCCR